MAVITINTVPISDFFIGFANAIGMRGFYTILGCILLYQITSFIQLARKSDKRNRKREIENKLYKFFSSKQEEINKIENPEEFKEETDKLLEWKSKMETKYGKFTYY